MNAIIVYRHHKQVNLLHRDCVLYGLCQQQGNCSRANGSIRRNPPSSWDEEASHNSTAILTDLRESLSVDLGRFHVPDNQMVPRLILNGRIGRSSFFLRACASLCLKAQRRSGGYDAG